MVPMELKWLLLVAVLATSYHYGFIFYLYVSFAAVSFVIGYAFHYAKDPVVDKKIACKIERGIKEMIERMERKPAQKLTMKISGASNLDQILNEIIDFIMRDYVEYWHQWNTGDEEFLYEVRKSICKLLTNISQRCQRVDWIPFMTEDMPNDIGSHLRLYRRTLERLHDRQSADLEKVFFDLESEMEKTICREDICLSRDKEKEYLQRVCDVILYILLPPEEFRTVSLRYLVREILINCLILPTLDLLCDSDYVNQWIVSLCKDSSYTSEYFIQAVRMSDSADELGALIDKVASYAARLRGRDTGGEDDAIIKAQLGSLEYLKKACAARLKIIQSGLPNKPDLSYPPVSPGDRVCDMSFVDVMNNQVAVASYLDYLTSVGENQFLSLYLDLLGYREAARLKLSETSAQPTAATKDVSGSSPPGLEPPVLCTPSDSAGSRRRTSAAGEVALSSNPTNQHQLSGQQMDELRASGLSLCDSLLDCCPNQKQIAEEVKRVSQRLRNDPVTHNLFAPLEELLLGVLQEERLFGGFKRSTYYLQLLTELDLRTCAGDEDQPPTIATTSGDDYLVAGGETRMQDNSFSSTGRSSDNLSLNSDDGCSQAGDVAQSHAAKPTQSQAGRDICKARIIKSAIVRDSYVLYTLEVTTTTAGGQQQQLWETQRRFSDFDDLHNLIQNECGKISQLKLPAKKPFNRNREFLEKRERDLNNYLDVLLSPELQRSRRGIRFFVEEFLQPVNWEKRRTLPQMLSLVNPLRVMGNAIIWPENLTDSFARMLFSASGQQDIAGVGLGHPGAATASSTNGVAEEDFDLGKLDSGLDQADAVNIPMRILFLLVDEVFDLQQKNQVVRRGILAILRRLVKAFFGIKVNKIIIEKATKFTSAGQLAVFAQTLRDTLWPEGSVGPPQKMPPREETVKMRTKVLCRAKMLGSVADELSQFLGNETTRRGVQRVFNLLQHERLNRRLLHVFLDGALRRLFSGHPLDMLAECELCPRRLGRSCANHKTAPPVGMQSVLSGTVADLSSPTGGRPRRST